MDAFLFHDIVTTELALVLTENALTTVRADASRALAARPELVLEGAFFHRAFRLQHLCGQVGEAVFLHHLCVYLLQYWAFDIRLLR